MITPLYGLVLVGGKSSRMGQDKALLQFSDNGTQLERTAQLLNTVTEQVFISQRKAQHFTLPESAAPIFDAVSHIKGPLCGILSAMQAHPQADWLVVACDLPNLAITTLQKLITEYRKEPNRLTAYKSTYDGLPEPLCAIYPAGKDAELLARFEETAKASPRDLLISQKARLIEQCAPESLDNINTPEEFNAFIGKK